MAVSAQEFMKREAPALRGSRMEPYARTLQMLRAKKYTLAQLQTFLEENGVEVSTAAISMYLSNLKKSQEPAPRVRKRAAG